MYAKNPDLLREENRKSRRLLGLAFALTSCFMVLEALAGLYSGSLALISDAAHMLVDSLALAMNWLALGLSMRPADSQHTYGYYRIQVISAFLNGILLAGLSLWIIVEAISRLLVPTPVLGGPMLAVALTGLMVNLLVLKLLGRHGHGNLNHQAARLNVLGDTLGSVAAVVGGFIILVWQFHTIDPLLSIFISAIIIKAAWGMIKGSWGILMEAQQHTAEPEAISARLMQLPLVQDVHHLHLWTLTPERPIITLHVKVDKSKDAPLVLCQVQKILLEEFGISHTTIQMESEDSFHEEEAELVLPSAGGKTNGHVT